MPETEQEAKGAAPANPAASRYMHFALGSGAGAAIAFAVIDALQKQPGFVPALINGGALYFAFGVVALLLFDRRAAANTQLQERNVTAQEQLAANVGALVNKSSERERENEMILNHLASQYQEILEGIGAIREGLKKP